MSKQIAKNTFTGGLLMDMHPLSSQNTVLTNALNATLVTIDGDEMILQNDMGNLKVTHSSNGVEEDVTLSPGFIPIGVNTLNGIAYIVSFNPNTQEGEIGTFPSPDYPLSTPSSDCCISQDGYDPVIPDDPIDPDDPDDPIDPDDPVNPDDPVIPETPPEYVDLGLGVYWAKTNIGAENESDYGDYYAWGELNTKSVFTRENYKYLNVDIGTDIVGDTRYDVATKKYGKAWHMPTEEQMLELTDTNKCSHEWATVNGVNGYKITSKVPGYIGNSIFLPAAGYKNSLGLQLEGETGKYRASTYRSDPELAMSLGFKSEETFSVMSGERHHGFSVRPVRTKGVVTYSLSIKSSSGGSVSYNGTTITNKTQSFTVNEGTSATITITPNTGYKLNKLTVNGTNMTSSVSNNRYTISNISTDTTVVALFAIKGDSEFPVPEAVDLGLSVKWAKWSMGAKSEYDVGGYYGWGDPTGENMSWNSWEYANNYKESLLNDDLDIATLKWGPGWRLPTEAEVKELLDNSKRKHSDVASGYELICNGKTIFIPKGGYMYKNKINSEPVSYYWTKEQNDSLHPKLLAIYSTAQYKVISTNNKAFHLHVRPVYDDRQSSGGDTENKYDKYAVDLGLSSLWSTVNLGATEETQSGKFYAWGETESKTSFTKDNYAYTIVGGEGENTYQWLGDASGVISGTEYDAVKVAWGGDWVMPTYYDLDELYERCKWEATTKKGVAGYKVTGPNGNSIFLPLTGYYNGSELQYAGQYARYWAGTVRTLSKKNEWGISYNLNINPENNVLLGTQRHWGAVIRPVRAKNNNLRSVKKLRALKASSKAESEVLAYDVNSSKEGYESHKNLVNKYQPLYNLYKGCNCSNGLLSCLELKQDKDITCLLHPLRTTHFNFNLEHPVEVNLQPSYDGSVNIIINDGYNIPRLINSRFSAKGDGTWEVPDRSRNTNNIYTVYEGCMEDYEEPMCECENGEMKNGVKDIKCGCNDVSCEQEIKNQSLFDLTTSLNKRISQFPIVKYNGVLTTGNLPVGNYVLYFKYCDEDGNETDFIAESGIISIFKGFDGDPFTIDGGERDMDSNKSINVTLLLIDDAYDFIKVYYSRTSAAADENRTASAFEILKPYEVSKDSTGKICNIIINGDEEKQLIPITELNQPYAIIDSAETQVLINNRLFMGNVESQNLYHKELTELSLRVIPYVKKQESSEKIGYITPVNYSDIGQTDENPKKHIFKNEYYNTKNIYYNVGYWNEEYYRLGIVYIFEDGSLSPVFNTLGYKFILPISESKEDSEHEKEIKNYIISTLVKYDYSKKLNYLKKDEDYMIPYPDDTNNLIISEINASRIDVKTLNSKGVIQIQDPDSNLSRKYWELYNIGIYMSSELISELKNKYCIRGFFVVRQKRIPTVLALGYTLPWDKESKVPVVEFWGRSIPYVNSGALTVNNVKNFNSTSDEGWSNYYNYLKNMSPFACNYDDNFMWHQKYFVESFLRQAGDGINADDPVTEVTFSREVVHSYIPRLYNILPSCIDAKMIDLNDGQSISKLNLSVKFLARFNSSLYTYYEQLYNAGRFTNEEYTELLNDLHDLDNEGYNSFREAFGAATLKVVITSENGTVEHYVSSNIYVDNNFIINIVDDTDYSNYEIIEQYSDGTHTADTLNQLLGEITYSDDTEIEIKGTFGIRNNENQEELKQTYTLFKGNISPEDLVYDYEVKKGYVYESYPNAGMHPNYYYTDCLVSDAEGYMLLYSDNVKGTHIFANIFRYPYKNIQSYFVNWKLSDDEGPDNWNEMRHNESIIKHYYNLYKYVDGNQLTAICPEFELRQPFFNQLFTGTDFTIKYNKYLQGILVRDESKERLYYPIRLGKKGDIINGEKDLEEYYNEHISDLYTRYNSGALHRVGVGELTYFYHYDITDKLNYKIVGITDNVPVVAIDNTIFKGVLGDAGEAYRFAFINEEHSPRQYTLEKRDWGGIDWWKKDKKHYTGKNEEDFNMCRGIYSPYLGIVSLNPTVSYKNKSLNTEKLRLYCRTFTIYDNSYNDKFNTNYKIRILDSSSYYSISERISFNEVDILSEHIPEFSYNTYENETSETTGIVYDLFRGDSFICTFTHRLNRNFNDPVAPSNDKIVTYSTWHDNYAPDESPNDNGVSKLSKINRGDINAVKLGSWITIKVKSSYNLSIRSLDERYLSEKATMGRARGFYPLQQASADGGYKIPNSYLINDGFGSTVGEKIYNTLPDAPYYNNYYEDRIIYSDVNIQDAYKNGYRIFRSSSITDYTKQYGKIVKLVDWYGHIICIFEHGVGILPINERIESGEGVGGPVFIDNNKVLPDVPSIISDKFGSQWKDSVIKTPYAIYGVDTSTKKIWKITGSTTLPTLSIISDFKVENFLKEHLNVNDTKLKVLIALKNVKSHYNQTKSDVIFTFYMTNTNRLEGQLDREKYDEEAWSLCLNEITSDQNTGGSGNFVTFYSWIPLESFNLNNKFYSFDREIVRGILSFPELKLIGTEEPEPKELIDYIGKPVYDENGNLVTVNNYCGDETYYYKEYHYPSSCMNALNLWEHNNPFIRPLPTHWYGKQHPFEFEFIVMDDPSVLKIYEDLKIISNNAKPESFHFSITGDNYEFTEDIPNIFYRLEATKELYSTLGSPISYNENYIKVHPNQLMKSTIFPLYYNKIDVYDNIYDLYQLMTGEYRDYQNLSGTEIYRNPRSKKFELVTHIKNTPIDGEWIRITKQNAEELLKEQYNPSKDFDTQLEELYNLYYTTFNMANKNCNLKLKKVKNPEQAFECNDNNYWYYIWIPQSRLRGNSHYKEDKWNVQIPTITLMLKNEPKWENWQPPLVLNWIPKLKNYEITGEDLPNTYNIGQISTDKWTFRKETKLRDKYCKIKVRYSGEELAIISAVLTTFNISYA